MASEKLLDYLRIKGVEATTNVIKMLEYFETNCAVVFIPPGMRSYNPEIVDFLSKKLTLTREDTITNMGLLERASIVGFEKGEKSPGGREYWYGLLSEVRKLITDSP